MRVVLVTPAPREARTGNRTTAERWSRILRGLSHRVRVVQRWDGEPCDLLVALHARKSYTSVDRFRRVHPERPLIVALTGTDIYRDLERDGRVGRAMELSDRLIALQPLVEQRVPRRLRSKIRLVYQSVMPRGAEPEPTRRWFDVCVVAHLRNLKDPFRAALAARRLPPESRVRVLLAGGALSAGLESRARAEERRNPRFRWLGTLPRWKVLQLLDRCRLLVVSSRMEGGANVVGEAVVAGVPVLASRIPGNVGLLGERYDGYFDVGDTRALAMLLDRCETELPFLQRLRRQLQSRRPLFARARETRSWRRLLAELHRTPTSR